MKNTFLWTLPFSSQTIENTYIGDINFLKVIKTSVIKCEMTGRKYEKGIFGGILLAPNLQGRFEVICDVGPEYIEENKIKVLTQKEIDDMLNEEAKNFWY